jgi:GT2 family glycosyltransferase
VSGSTLPVSAAIPTIGRFELLERCLASIAACNPRAAEILVVDQSGDAAIAELVGRHADSGARLVRSPRRSRSHARNLALKEAANDLVAFTDDDCTVEPNWVEAAWTHAGDRPQTAVTGRVLPVGDDPDAVPSTIDAPERRDYTGMRLPAALFGNNMVMSRSTALALGGFDHRVIPAEDNDFSYRWLAAGYTIRYEPDLVVHHHDWRDHRGLERLYVEYARGQGKFYAKHLRQGDMTMVRLILRHFYLGARAWAVRFVKGRPRWSDERQAFLISFPGGLVQGWRAYGRSGRGARALERDEGER